MGYTEKIVVIGAGISGLACAYRLKLLGARALVLEASDRPGGLISTIRKNGCLFETGPQFPRFPASLWRLVRELNLEGEFVAGNPKAKRYILRHGHLQPAPFSPASLISSRLLGLPSKFRILTEALRSSHAPAHEESLAQFVERKFGSEVLDNLVDPIVSTIFFGDSKNMGMESAFPDLVEWERTHGSLVRGALRARKSTRAFRDSSKAAPSRNVSGQALRVTDELPSLGSFTRGMGALIETLAENLRDRIRYDTVATSLSRTGATDQQNKSWQIGLSSGEHMQAENVVFAAPAYVTAKLLQEISPRSALDLSQIAYAPACVVSFVYDRSQVVNSLDGFGFMVPRQEGLHTICTFWNSSLFADRAPAGEVLITSFAASRDKCDMLPMPEEECAQIVHNENAAILGIRGKPGDHVVWRDAHALPQYNIGHKQRIARIRGSLSVTPQLYLVGNFVKGRSLGDCVDLAFDCADELYSRLQN